MPDEPAAVEFRVQDHPDPADIEVLEAQIRREASAAMGLGDEADLAIFVRDAGRVVAGISGWTWGDCCELQSLWVEPSLRGRGLATRLLAAAEAEAAARGCSQTVHFTYAFQARALYERNGYELAGRVADFPAGTDVLWYRKRLTPPQSPPSREQSRSGKTQPEHRRLDDRPRPRSGDAVTQPDGTPRPVHPSPADVRTIAIARTGYRTSVMRGHDPTESALEPPMGLNPDPRS